MKTFLRIIIILLAAAAVAGAFYLAVNNSSAASTSDEGIQPPALTGRDGQTIQPMVRPDDGDREGGSIAGGLGGLFLTLVKVSGLVLLVVGLQKGFDLIYSNKRRLVQR